MNLNPNINISAGRLYTALQNNSVFVKKQNSDDVAKVTLELDYSTFVQLQELLSDLSPKEPQKESEFRSLADTFRNLKNADKMDFDIDFDNKFYHQKADFSDLETLFDD